VSVYACVSVICVSVSVSVYVCVSVSVYVCVCVCDCVCRLPGLTPISEQAGRLLYDRGGAPSISAGVVMFHEAITTDKPSLRKILRRADEAAGRRPRRKRSVAQKLVAMTVKAGGFTRTKTGQLKTMKPGFRRRLKVEQKRAARLKLAARKKREKSVLRRLGVRR